jgi:hypothetical protein
MCEYCTWTGARASDSSEQVSPFMTAPCLTIIRNIRKYPNDRTQYMWPPASAGEMCARVRTITRAILTWAFKQPARGFHKRLDYSGLHIRCDNPNREPPAQHPWRKFWSVQKVGQRCFLAGRKCSTATHTQIKTVSEHHQ